ncbi:hypothetical protein L1049_013654 [Liquidambar formosana]|uniref:Myb/SANT-like domain-containing protein n=1 Tax=Liquidambar formosana TaxID=63359 RepID=A0AAP0WYQ0_LIQFO
MATTSVDKDSTVSIVPQVEKHQWTPGGDERLVKSLYELYTMGMWKCDTSFKSGYLLQLEKMWVQKIPSAGVGTTHHIEYQVKTLKKQIMAIAKMFTISSGFSWNDVDKIVEVAKIVYDLWVKDCANRLGATTLAAEEEAIEVAAANAFNGSSQFKDGLEGIKVSSTQP